MTTNRNGDSSQQHALPPPPNHVMFVHTVHGETPSTPEEDEDSSGDSDIDNPDNDCDG